MFAFPAWTVGSCSRESRRVKGSVREVRIRNIVNILNVMRNILKSVEVLERSENYEYCEYFDCDGEYFEERKVREVGIPQTLTN